MPGYNVYGDRNIKHQYTDDMPGVHEVLKEVRRTVSKYPGDPVLVTEADEPNVEALTKMYGDADEVQLPMDFQIADVNKMSAPKFRRLFDEIENNTAHGQPEYFFSNHDQPRQWDRYGDGKHNDQIAKLMAVLELTTRGTPQMYYGEELGMRTTDPARIEDVHDPIGKLGWPKEKGRDGERTPMQWDATGNAGFTTGKPWLAVPPSAKTYNVELESKESDSILNTYKKLLALRKTNVALRDGTQVSVGNDPDVFAFLRKSGNAMVLVVLNMSGRKRSWGFKPDEIGARENVVLTPMYSSPAMGGDAMAAQHLVLAPFAALVLQVK
jgi:alpha-glucosidase